MFSSLFPGTAISTLQLKFEPCCFPAWNSSVCTWWLLQCFACEDDLIIGLIDFLAMAWEDATSLVRGFPWWSDGWESILPPQGPQVWSLVGELREKIPPACDAAKNKEKKAVITVRSKSRKAMSEGSESLPKSKVDTADAGVGAQMSFSLHSESE